MKIREGAYYRTRGGDVVGPMARFAGCDDTFTAIGHTWNEYGSFVRGNPYKLDLISEVWVYDTPPDAPSEDTIIRMNFSEMARAGSKTNSGNVHFFHGLHYIHAHYSVILHWEEGQEPAAQPTDGTCKFENCSVGTYAPAPETKTLRDEFVMRLMDRDMFAVGFIDEAEQLYRVADAMMEARKK
jgi:hypothetical protein